jgi:protein-L-isoaspartate(D-aspartate) O-methyltransferase
MTKTDYDSARTAMVDCQVRPADVTHYHIIESMLKIPREEFFPERLKSVAYAGVNIEIGVGRYALEPRLIGKMLNLINIREDELVLDVGSGFGYAASLIANFAQAVVMVEEPPYVKEAERILLEQSIDNVIVRSGKLADGAKEHGPYDAMIFEGAIEQLPSRLLKQLKIGGRVVAVVRNGVVGECCLGLKVDSGLEWRFGFNATAPLLRGFEKKEAFIF